MLLSQKVIQSSVEVIERERPLSPAILYDLAVLVDTICFSDKIVTLQAGCGTDIAGSELHKALKEQGLAFAEKPLASPELLEEGCKNILQSLQVPDNGLADKLMEVLFKQVTRFIQQPPSHQGEKDSVTIPLLQLDDLLKTETEEQTAIYYARSFLYWLEATQARKDTLIMDYGRVPFLNSFLNAHNNMLTQRIRDEILGNFENEREKLLEWARKRSKEVYPLPLLLSAVLTRCKGDKRAIIAELISLRNNLSKDRARLMQIEKEMSEARSHTKLLKIKKIVSKLKKGICKKFGGSDSAHLIKKYGIGAFDAILKADPNAIKDLMPIEEFLTWFHTRPAAELVSLMKADSLVDYPILKKIFGELPSEDDFRSAYSLYRSGRLL
jgi:hypothetical protein